jgi:hypothetical protein
LCSNNAEIIYLSYNRLITIIDFLAKFPHKRFADVQSGKFLGIARPAVTLSIHYYHNRPEEPQKADRQFARSVLNSKKTMNHTYPFR